MAFAVEIALAKAIYYDSSKLRIKNKQEFYHVLIDRETLSRVLSKDNNKEEYQKYKHKIVGYFMNIKYKVKLGNNII
jgi:hypothetical protein